MIQINFEKIPIYATEKILSKFNRDKRFIRFWLRISNPFAAESCDSAGARRGSAPRSASANPAP